MGILLISSILSDTPISRDRVWGFETFRTTSVEHAWRNLDQAIATRESSVDYVKVKFVFGLLLPYLDCQR